MTLLPAFILYSGQDNWLWAFAGLAAGLYCFYRGFHLLQRRRLILDIPASKVRSASLGLVEMNGLAAGPYTMQAPLSGKPCYYYRSMAWQLKPSAKSNRWEKVADESLHVPFYLDDNTGRVLVDPQGAEIDIHRDFQDEFHTSPLSSRLDLPTNVASFLVRHGLDTSQKLKLEEYCIKPKNALFILGTLAPNPGVSVSATPVHKISDDPIKFTFDLDEAEVMPRHSVTPPPSPGPAISKSVTRNAVGGDAGLHLAPEVVRLQGARPPSSSANMSQQEKVAAALVQAGISNPAAWAAAEAQLPEVAVSSAGNAGASAGAVSGVGTAAGTGAATAKAPESEFDFNPKTVLMKGLDDSSFFISWRSQRAIVQSLAWKSTLMIWGGPALSLLSLFMLLQHFGWM